MKKRFPLQERYIANLGILDSVADQDLTRDPSSIANVVLHFPHLVPEEQLESISIVETCRCPVNLSLISVFCVASKTAWITRCSEYFII